MAISGNDRPTHRISLPVVLHPTLQSLDPGSWEQEIGDAITRLQSGGASADLRVHAQKATLLIRKVEEEIPVGAALVWADFATDFDRWKSSQPDPSRGVRALPEYESQARINKVGGTVILIADCVIAAFFVVDNFLDRESANRFLFGIALGLVAVLLSIGIALGTKALAGKMILQPEEQPQVGKQRGGRLASVLGLLAALPVAGFIIARQAVALPDMIANYLTDFSIAFLSVLLPPLSGVLWALGQHLGWSAAHEQRARRWQQLDRKVATLRRECEAVLGFESVAHETERGPASPRDPAFVHEEAVGGDQ